MDNDAFKAMNKLWRPITGYPATWRQQEQYYRWIGQPLRKAKSNAGKKSKA